VSAYEIVTTYMAIGLAGLGLLAYWRMQDGGAADWEDAVICVFLWLPILLMAFAYSLAKRLRKLRR
jgi:ABC-type Fe3+-siderophore transport system permease subunit